jgi:hypothetical protein
MHFAPANKIAESSLPNFRRTLSEGGAPPPPPPPPPPPQREVVRPTENRGYLESLKRASPVEADNEADEHVMKPSELSRKHHHHHHRHHHRKHTNAVSSGNYSSLI